MELKPHGPTLETLDPSFPKPRVLESPCPTGETSLWPDPTCPASPFLQQGPLAGTDFSQGRGAVTSIVRWAPLST